MDASLIFLLALKGFLNFNIRILLGKTLVVSLHRNISDQEFKLQYHGYLPIQILSVSN